MKAALVPWRSWPGREDFGVRRLARLSFSEAIAPRQLAIPDFSPFNKRNSTLYRRKLSALGFEAIEYLPL
jgi:hypothetical protein